MGLIDTIKDMRVAELEDKNMAIVVIILNVFPIPGLGTLISGLIAEDASDVTKVGIVQLLFNIPWFLLFLPLVIIPLVGQIVYLGAIGVYCIIDLINMAFGVVWGIKTYKVAAAVSGGSADASAPMEA